MSKTILLYWATGGNVEKAAKEIYAELGADKLEMADLASFDYQRFDEFDNFIFGIATVGAEIWRDTQGDNYWNDFFVELENKSFEGKKFAFYGLGNQVLYPEHYVDALGYLKNEVDKRNGTIVGFWPTEGYSYTDSEGEADGKFFGLALDEDFQKDLTPERIKQWTAQISHEMGL